MQKSARFEETMKFGELVEAAYDLGGRIAPDRAGAAALTARRLERVLVRAGNLRLQWALLELARELGPSSRRAIAPSNARRAAAAR